ncbi:MAG: ABC transporter permease [Zetaproteobacteria bacterium]|nr:ABC transporter permease [Zetaproteobacteria bacterium]
MLAMAFSCMMMILFSALMQGMLLGSERNVVAMNLGEIQIHAKGYLQEHDLYQQVEDVPQLLQQLYDAGFDVTPRLFTYGLAAAGLASAGVEMRGVDLQREVQVTELYRHVGQGGWLQKKDSQGVVLGKKLAASLGVNPGDEVMFVGQTADGYIADAIFTVRGVLKSVADGIDRTGFFVSMEAWRALIGVPEGAHALVLKRRDQDWPLDQACVRAKKIASEHAGNALQVQSWKMRMPVIARMLEMADVQIWVMIIITYLAVAMVVLNAMLMNVFERLREFGMLKALGMPPQQIVLLIYLETMMQTLIAAVIGVLGGVALSFYYSLHGIDLSSLAGAFTFGGIAFDPIWYAALYPGAIWAPVAFLFAMVALAVLYPAMKAARTQPIVAMQRLHSR